MTKQVVSDPTIKAISQRFFTMAQRLLDQMGSVDPSLYTVSLEGEKIDGLAKIPLTGDFRDAIASKIGGLIAKNAVVVTMAEAWAASPSSGMRASQAPDRYEIVSLIIYANGTQHYCAFKIERFPTRLVYEEPIIPEGLVGRMAPGGGNKQASPADNQKTLSMLKKTLEADHDEWLSGAFYLFEHYLFGNTDITPLTDMLYSINLPSERAEKAIQLLWRMLTVESAEGIGFDGQLKHKDAWLTGVRLRVGRVAPKATASIESALDTFTERFRRKDPSCSKLCFAPGGKTYSLLPYESVGLLRGLLLDSANWNTPNPTVDPQMIGHLNKPSPSNRFDASANAEWTGRHLTLYAVAFDQSEASNNRIQYNRRWQIPESEVIGALLEASDGLYEECGFELFVEGVNPASEALKLMGDSIRADKIQSIVADTSLPKDDISVEITLVVEKKESREHLFAIVWRKDGALLAPARFPRYPNTRPETLIESVAESFRQAGVENVQVASEYQVVDKLPGDKANLFAPDFQGGWFSITDMIFPASKGMLSQAYWDYVDEEAFLSPDVAKLPFPHRLARAGLSEVFQRHYSTPVYRVIKEVLADLSISSAEVWGRVCDKEQRFKRFMEETPELALPGELEWLSARVVWGKASTLFTTPALAERLSLTDVDFRLPAQFARTPFSLCYLHFADNTETKERVSSQSNTDMRLEGAFIESAELAEGVRLLEITPIWTSASERWRSVYSTISLQIDDEFAPVADYLDAHYANADVPSDLKEDDKAAIEEVLKVLVYLNLREARVVEKPARTQFLKGMKGKKGDQQQKLLEKAAGLCDYVLVGPEALPSLIQAEGLSGRTMPIHARRGHIHTYRTGKGRKEISLRFIEPIIVNKHLLKDGQTSPAARDIKIT